MPSFVKKTMVYLGLVDDDYDEYEDYDDRSQRGMAPSPRPEPRLPEVEEPEERAPVGPGPVGRIRTLPREHAPAVPNPGTLSPPPPPQATMTPRPAAVRPVGSDSAAKVHVVAPQRFGDAKEIADYLKGNRPVIVNLQVAERDLQRRMIDFCSGLTYALSGEMERVADEVFLLTPTNVKVSEEERQRLQERGLVRS
jgi:cell division inhibitor SepF